MSLSPFYRLGRRLRSARTCRISVTVSGLNPDPSDSKALDIVLPPCSLWLASFRPQAKQTHILTVYPDAMCIQMTLTLEKDELQPTHISYGPSFTYVSHLTFLTHSFYFKASHNLALENYFSPNFWPWPCSPEGLYVLITWDITSAWITLSSCSI